MPFFHHLIYLEVYGFGLGGGTGLYTLDLGGGIGLYSLYLDIGFLWKKIKQEELENKIKSNVLTDDINV